MSVTVSSTELKTNLGYYLDLISKGFVVFVTRNGKITGKLTSAVVSPVEAITGILEGKLPDDINTEDLRDERLRI